MTKIILASASPRRQMLLRLIGLNFRAVKSGVKEDGREKNPEKLVKRTAEKKAEAVAKNHANALIIAADTVVVFRGRVIGKPKSKKEAEAMLAAFSGKKHDVYTGLCVINKKTGKKFTVHSRSSVKFRKLDKKEIESYVRTGEPLDKAGGYNIAEKGVRFLEGIEGSYSNVVGLPLEKLIPMLRKNHVYL